MTLLCLLHQALLKIIVKHIVSVDIFEGLDDNQATQNHGRPLNPQSSTSKRLTLDLIVTQYIANALLL